MRLSQPLSPIAALLTASVVLIVAVGTARAADSPVASAAGLGPQLTTAQHALAAARAQLLGVGVEIRLGQATLARLELSAQRDQQVLASELVGAYESGQPDVATKQTLGIVARAVAARGAVAAEAVQLGGLSSQRPGLAERVDQQRARLAAVRSSLSQASKAGRSGSNNQDVDVAPPEGAPASAGAESPSHRTGFMFPLPEGDASPPATWSVAGGAIDIAAPAWSPELAVCGGTIVLHGIGGLGVSTPVLHCDSPIAGADYVYYGDAGPTHLSPIGRHVDRGQVISAVGAGIIANSTGPDLQIGLADSSGGPLPASSAAKLEALLRASYRS